MCLNGASYSAMATALGCSNRDIAKAKAVIAAQSVTKESFVHLSPSFFEEHFGDIHILRKQQFHQPDLTPPWNRQFRLRIALFWDISMVWCFIAPMSSTMLSPSVLADINDNLIRHDGMTRRELFAAD